MKFCREWCVCVYACEIFFRINVIIWKFRVVILIKEKERMFELRKERGNFYLLDVMRFNNLIGEVFCNYFFCVFLFDM